MTEDKFIKVTLYNGLIGYVNVGNILGFSETKDSNFPNVNTTIVVTSGKRNAWWVKETVNEILKLINGGKKWLSGQCKN